jgi:hypothetical protein
MLSKKELKFLESPQSFDPAYSRVLRYRIKAKSAQLREALLLLQGNGLSVTENCNSVTEYSNANQSLNQVYFCKKHEKISAPAGIWTRVADSRGRHT